MILESLEPFQNSRNRNEQIKYITDFFHSISLTSDPEQIKQVLWNLFLNACEAMPADGTLSILTRMEPDPAEPDKEIVRIVVHDTGNGFDKKSLSQLFIPFFTTKEGGSGLGLAIVKRIVESLNGSIYGRNHPEGGAEISLLLPCVF